jgi:hypothetical protein
VSTGAATEVAPPGRDFPKPRPWLALVAAAALLLLGGGLWWLWPEGPGAEAPGRATIGTSPTAHGNGSVGPAAEDDQLLVDPPVSPGSTVPPQLPPDVRQGTLAVRTEIAKAELLAYTLRVTISNVGDVTGSWHSVALRLSGLNLVVEPAGSVVRYEYRAPLHCLIPGAAVALGPGESITLDVSVTGTLGGVQSTRLDEAPCPT